MKERRPHGATDVEIRENYSFIIKRNASASLYIFMERNKLINKMNRLLCTYVGADGGRWRSDYIK